MIHSMGKSQLGPASGFFAPGIQKIVGGFNCQNMTLSLLGMLAMVRFGLYGPNGPYWRLDDIMEMESFSFLQTRRCINR